MFGHAKASRVELPVDLVGWATLATEHPRGFLGRMCMCPFLGIFHFLTRPKQGDAPPKRETGFKLGRKYFSDGVRKIVVHRMMGFLMFSFDYNPRGGSTICMDNFRWQKSRCISSRTSDVRRA